ncbi:MAG: DUF5615 family PIN-like protein [Patescibacteria group bacterium]
MSLKLLCDENIPYLIKTSLEQRGFDVGCVTPGMKDNVVAELARREQRILITFDSDFANILAYPPSKYFGILRINIHPPFPNIILVALERVFNVFKKQKDFHKKLIIVEASTFRIWEEHEKTI